ncbi:hypothetical protein AB0J86_24055 [Micromonospora sp. NPDC049559]|uniref:hypothetical protein n=1 Tax=Micromonospora sp. NPDC049559 TaxID=3155923 RepID=UPI0034241072
MTTATTPSADQASQADAVATGTDDAPSAGAGPERPDRFTRALRLIRRNPGITGLLALGVVVRLLMMVAYPPAFWFYGDSGLYVLMGKGELVPHPTRPIGYPALLKVLEPTHTHFAVVAVQHLLTLLLALAVYAVLVRRGVPRWIACVAAAPVIFDSLMLTLGHYLLPDVLFSVLLAGCVLVLLWSDKPGYPAVTASGLLIAAAWITKPSALPVALLLGLYLLVRRVGWRKVVAYALGFVLPYVGMMVWINGRPSVYGSQSATALYGRTAIIADCDRLKLTPDERLACPDQPLGQRWDRADAFFWRRPARLGDIYSPEGAQRLTDFARAVLEQQPLDYLRIVGKESAAHFVPGLYLGPMNECLRDRMVPPTQFQDWEKVVDRCPPAQAQPNFGVNPTNPRYAPKATVLTKAFHRYGEYLRTGPVVLSIGLLLSLAALFAWRRANARVRFDLLLLLAAGPGLTVLTVAVGMYEPRYALPALPLSAVAAAIAWQGLRTRRPAKTAPTEATATES